MAEYFDFGLNLNAMVTSLNDEGISISKYMGRFIPGFKPDSTDGEWKKGPQSHHRTIPIDSAFLQVRHSICLAGPNWDALQWTKGNIAKLSDTPLPLESFHIKKKSDMKEGTLLVPKIILVAPHCPGRKLIDEDGDEGVLDFIYDEVCEVGADLLVVYTGLPRAVYPPVRHMVYHPKMAELLFPSQPILRSLAQNYSLITVVGNSELTSMQKNVIREWLSRPVGDDHPVFEAASHLSAVEYTFSEAEFWSESELYRFKKPVPYYENTKYLTATEEHPLADIAEKRRRKKMKKKKPAKSKYGTSTGLRDECDLIDFNEDEESNLIELNVYRDSEMGRASNLSNSLRV